MFDKIHYAMVMVSDMDRSVRFYRDVMGFKLRFQSPDWTEFATEGTTLALHGGARPRAENDSQHEKPAGTVSLGMNVSDLDEAVRALKARGAHFIMEPSLREGEGIRLAVLIDPDGMPISLAQSIAN